MFPKVRANIEISMIPGVMRLQLEALTTKFAKGVLSLKLSHSRLQIGRASCRERVCLYV